MNMMQNNRLFCILILLCLYLLGHTFSSYGKQEVTLAEETAEDTTQEQKYQETFTKLRDMFPNAILDADFKTLKEVTQTKAYLDFLKQNYPTEEPFETLGEFLKVAPTPVERYQPVLKEHFENLIDTDFRSIHLLTMIYRRSDMLMMLAAHIKDKKDIRKAFTERVFILGKEPIRTWWQARISREKDAKKMAFLLALDSFAKETQKEDAHWIQTQFEVHGQEKAMLWLSLLKPRLTFEIVTNFSGPNTFLTWVEEVKKKAESDKP